MKRAAEKEKSDSRRSKRFRFAGSYEELPLPTEMEAQSFLSSVKEYFKNDGGKYAEFLQILDDFRLKTCDTIGVITRLKHLLKSRKLLLSFNKFLPKGFEILFLSKEFLQKKQKVHFEDALSYIAKIKIRFQNEEYIRKRFFEILSAYKKGNKRKNDIHTEVKSLFCDHQDLVDEFAYFLPASSSFLVPRFQDSLNAVKDSHKEDVGKAECILGKYPEVVAEFKEIISQSSSGKPGFDLGGKEYTKHDKTGKGKEKWRNFDGVLQEENKRMKETDCEENRGNLRQEEKDREEDRDRHKDRHHKSRAMLDSSTSEVANNVKITYKPISEMNLSYWGQRTPSYRLIPQNLVKPMTSCSDGSAAGVLNDICVSVPSRAEDNRKQKQVNLYEEAIFDCEDDRFEMDMLIENSRAAIKRIHELLEKEHDNTTQTSAHFRIENHLTAMDLRCIERIYGDCGLHMIDLLREKPDLCLPVIVKRLQQKHGEWVNCQSIFNIGWADVYAKNYQRSLDHIGSCLRQIDAKRRRTHLHF